MPVMAAAPVASARGPGGYGRVIGALGSRVQRDSGTQASARCPAHDDRIPSLSVSRGDDGRALLRCHAGCTQADVVAALGLEMADLFAEPLSTRPPQPMRSAPRASTPSPSHVRRDLGAPVASYAYHSADGQLCYWVHRFACRDGTKTFRAQRPDGGWDLDGVERVLFGLPDLAAAVAAGRTTHAYVVEGEKDVQTVTAAGGLATCNPGGVGQGWQPAYTAQLQAVGITDVTVIPDHDAPGLSHAQAVAASCAAAGLGVTLLPPFGTAAQEKYDVSDWWRDGGSLEALEALRAATPPWVAARTLDADTGCPKCGRDSCDGGCEPARPPDSAPAPSPRPIPTPEPALRFLPAGALMAEPWPDEVVEGLVWAGQVSLLVAESGTGKTFVALALAAAVSAGRRFAGRRTAQGAVAYVSFEGDYLGVRVRALDATGRDLTHIYVVQAQAALNAPPGPASRRDADLPTDGQLALTDALIRLRQQLAQAGAPPLRLIVLDTLSASTAGSANDDAAMVAYLRAVRSLLAPCPEAGVILVHHPGWQDGDTKKKRERGSSVLRGNVDAAFYVEAQAAEAGGHVPLVVTTAKTRDAAHPAPLRLVRRVVTLAGECDPDGRPRTSCVVEPDAVSHAEREAAHAAEVKAVHEAALEQLARQAVTACGRQPVTGVSQLRDLLACQQRKASEAAQYAVARGWMTKSAIKGTPYLVTAAGHAEVLTGAHGDRYRRD